MIDESTERGAQILGRLRKERVIWMTTVDNGAPQPAPVWFLYEHKPAMTGAKPITSIASESSTPCPSAKG